MLCRKSRQKERAFLHSHAAAQHHGTTSYGACFGRHHSRHDNPFQAHAGLCDAVAARKRPCLDRHRSQDSRGDEKGRSDQKRRRQGRIPRTRLGLDEKVRKQDLRADKAPRLFLRLEQGGIHDGRALLESRRARFRRSLQQRSDLQRRQDNKLVPFLQDRAFRRGGGIRRAGVASLAYPLSFRGRKRLYHSCHNAPRNHSRRHGSRGQSQRRKIFRRRR